jgi:hypothetical protein
VVIKKGIKSLIIIVASIVIATLLQFLVFALPTESMEENVKKSVEIFRTEGVYRDLIPGLYTTKQDNYTDAAMLLQAIYNGDESLSDRAMNVYCNRIEGKNYQESLIQYCETGESDWVHTYFWYWHGYMIFLKPLLMFFDYGDIRIINMFFQILVAAAFILCLMKKGFQDYILPFAAGYLLLSPMTINLSLQFSACYYMMLISSIMIVNYYERLEVGDNFFLVFLLAGMGTSFFDFLTYPIVTIGLPLITFFIVNKNGSIKYMIKKFIEFCISWGGGYVLFWAGKWLVASIILRQNCFVKAVERMKTQTSVSDFTIGDVYQRVMMWTGVKSYIVIFLVIFVILLVATIRRGISKKGVVGSLPLFVVAIFPLCWYFFASSHAYFHYWMEYRGCMLMVFGIDAAVVKWRANQDEEKIMLEEKEHA